MIVTELTECAARAFESIAFQEAVRACLRSGSSLIRSSPTGTVSTRIVDGDLR